jgi:hypothetical protein
MKKYKFIKPDPTLQNNLMEFGWECDKGWYPIIEEAFDKMEDTINKMPMQDKLDFQEHFEILQVKEKLGGLRIYVNMYPDEIIEIIREAEKKALQTCETCGKPGEIREIHHWYKTTCDSCYNKRLKELENDGSV